MGLNEVFTKEFQEALKNAQKRNTSHEFNFTVFKMQCELRDVLRMMNENHQNQ